MKYRLLLLLTAFFWGCAFVAQRVGMDFIGPLGFNGVRFWVGTLAVLPLVWWTRRTSTEVFAPHPSWLTLPIACAILGFFLFMGSALQQWGPLYDSRESRLYYIPIHRRRPHSRPLFKNAPTSFSRRRLHRRYDWCLSPGLSRRRPAH